MRRIQTGWAVTMLLTAGAVGAWNAAHATAQEPKPVPVTPVPFDPRAELNKPTLGPPKVTAEQVLAWRKQYPFQSLAGRLDYEAERAPKTSPPMTPDVAQRVKLEPQVGSGSIGKVRSESFRLLHEERVEDFVAQSGFGVARMPTAERGPRYYALPEVPKLPLAKLPENRANGSPDDEILTLPLTREAARATGGVTRWMPTWNDMQWFHWTGATSFSDWESLGYVKSIDAVVGFSSHAFRRFPVPPSDLAQFVSRSESERNPKYWKLVRLELVSLLKHETPRVYLSDYLPRMKDLSSQRTRELSQFETDSLTKLQAGEDLQVSATADRIEMFGSLRASKQCRQCHQVPEGTLLGAFTYDLRRDPPIPIEKTTAVVQ